MGPLGLAPPGGLGGRRFGRREREARERRESGRREARSRRIPCRRARDPADQVGVADRGERLGDEVA